MNRRNFFKALIAVGATTALAESLVEQALALPVVYGKSLIGPKATSGFEALKMLTIYGMEESTRAGMFTLKRVGGSGDLIRHCLNAYAGWARYVLPPEGAIIATHGHEIELLADFDGVAHLLTQDDAGDEHAYFWNLSRSDPPRMLQTVSRSRRALLPQPIDEEKPNDEDFP